MYAIWHGNFSIRYTGSGVSQEMQSQPLSLPYLGPPGTSYRVIYRWLLLVLGLEVPGRVPAAHQGQLLLVAGLGPFRESYMACQGLMLLVCNL